MTPEAVKTAIEAAVPGCSVSLVVNPGPSAQHSLLIDSEHAVEVACFLRDDPKLCFDFCSNVTGVDRLDTQLAEKIKVAKLVDGVDQEVEETRTTTVPGYLEAVYHLFSIEKKHGPVVVRLRTNNRTDEIHLPSLTPIWRSAEFQEREIFDLFGIVFDGHPDLRRILMWDGFTDHPMRRDYIPPADEEEEWMMEARS